MGKGRKMGMRASGWTGLCSLGEEGGGGGPQALFSQPTGRQAAA